MPNVQQMDRADYDAIQLMIQEGALVPLCSQKLPRRGFIKVVCPDGDNTPEMIQHFHHNLCVEANGSTVCTHLAPVTGGPAALPVESSMHNITYKGALVTTADKLIFSYIEGALTVKGNRIHNVSLVPHCPCGMASLKSISVWENFCLSFLAKDMIRKEFPRTFKNIKVTPHINYAGYPEAAKPSGPFRTYLLRRKPFERLCILHDRQFSHQAA